MLSNELRAGLSFATSYDDNVLGLGTTAPVADFTYSIKPSISLDQVTPRRHRTLTYSPDFTLYQHTSGRNEADQNVSADSQYRLTEFLKASVSDTFRKSTNVFNQAYGGVSGSVLSPVATIVAPFADQLLNDAKGELSYQFDRNGMVGGSGTSSILNFPNPAQAVGLFNSNSRSASAFYNLRLSGSQYFGVTYQYSWMKAGSANSNSETQTHTIYLFYTLYVKPSLSLSVSGGPQHSKVVESPVPAANSWSPAVTASIGWQSIHTSFAANYSRTVTGGGGLLGAFNSNTASSTARWQLARTWTVGSTGSYGITKSVTPLTFISTPGGHSISGSAMVQHSIGERFTVEGGYAHLHESYSGIAVISQYPDSDRAYISVSYQFTRPLGR